MGNVLFLSIDGMTDPLGQSQVLPYLAGLQRHGYRITVLSCEKPERFDKNGTAIERICSESGIVWKPIVYKSRIPLLSGYSNVHRLQRNAERLHLKVNFDIVHCRSYLPMFAGIRLKRKFGVSLLFDIRGFWPEERVDGGLWNTAHPVWKRVYKYFKSKEAGFYENSDRVITLTRNAQREIHTWPLANNPVPIDVIPCCADLELFDYHKINEDDRLALLEELDLLPSDDIITYLGSLGTFYGIEDMLGYFIEFKKVNARGKFLVITANAPEIVWRAADKMGIPRSDIRVTVSPRKRVPLHLSLGRYSLVFYRENYSRKACSPTKLGELMGLGIPVVCSPDVGDTTEIVRDAGAGYALTSLDADAYRDAVEFMERFPKDSREQIRRGAFKYFDLEDGIRKYKAVYEKLSAP